MSLKKIFNIRAILFSEYGLHPFLFCTIFVLESYLPLRGIVPLDKTVGPFLTIFVFSISLQYFSVKVRGSRPKGAIIASILILAILFYENGFQFIQNLTTFLGFVLTHKTTYPVLFIAIISTIAIVVVINSPKKFIRFNSFLNLLSVILLIVTAIRLISQTLPDRPRQFSDYLDPGEADFSPTSSREMEQKKPDVYYIILDAYTSSASLKSYWQFDNSEFEKFLEGNRFYIARNSRSNYNWTRISIASSLNMSYLNHLSELVGEWPGGYFRTLDLINHNEVTRQFRSLGYDVVNLSMFDVQDQPRVYRAITYINNRSVSQYLFNRTIIGSIIERLRVNTFYKINLDLIEQLQFLSSRPHPRPRFIYAHLYLPHEPYSFDRGGRVLSWWKRGNMYDKKGYLDQLVYTNKLIREVIETILTKSSSAPLIIIQGDHGYRLLGDQEVCTILNAYYLPEGGEKLLYDSISPVNSFRIIFNHYFGAKYPLLEDRSMIIEKKVPVGGAY